MTTLPLPGFISASSFRNIKKGQQFILEELREATVLNISLMHGFNFW